MRTFAVISMVSFAAWLCPPLDAQDFEIPAMQHLKVSAALKCAARMLKGRADVLLREADALLAEADALEDAALNQKENGKTGQAA